MSRRPLAVGELGNILVTITATRVTVEGRTRDASGSLRRLQASGSTEEIARDELVRKARRLGLKARELSLATTLSELLDAWLAVAIAPRGIKEQTKQAYKGQAGTIKRLAGALTIAELRPARLQTLLEGLAKDLTPANLKLMRSVLNQCLRYAVRTEVISHNPMDALDRVRALKKPRRKKALTPELIHLFRAEFADYVRDRPDVLGRRQAQLTTDIIIGLGGLRIAEALAFRHRDVDFEHCIADLNGTLVSLSGQPIYRQDTPSCAPSLSSTPHLLTGCSPRRRTRCRSARSSG